MSTRRQSIGRASLTIDVEMRKLTAQLKTANKQLQTSTRQMQRSMGSLENSAKKLDNSLGRTFRNFRGLAGAAIALTAGLQVRRVVEYADAWTRLNQQLGTVSATANEAAASQERLFDIAQTSRTSIGAVSELFVRLSRATADTNIEQETLFNSVQNLTEAITLAGVGAVQAEAGLLQLAQGFSKGRLDGDELRSVLENIPTLATAITQEMGVTVGALRDLGAAGLITRDVLISAFERLPEIVGNIEDAPLTVSQAFVQLNNSIGRYVGTVDQAIGASSSFASAISFISEAVDNAAEKTNDLAEAQKLLDAGGNFDGFFTGASRAEVVAVNLVKNLKDAEASDARLLALNTQIAAQIKNQADAIAGIKTIREADTAAVKKAAEESKDVQLKAIQQQQEAADKLIKTFESQAKIGLLDGSEEQLAQTLASIGADFDVLGDRVANASVNGLDQLRTAIEGTNFSQARDEIESLAASLESQARVASLSKGVQRDLGQELTKLGVSFETFNGALSNVDLPDEDFQRLNENIRRVSFAEASQGIAQFISELERQNQTIGLSSDRQKRLAEALESVGIAFEVVGSKVRSSVADQEQLTRLADSLDANAYTELTTRISEYVDQIERATRAEGLESDQQREIASLLDEVGQAWENVGGQVRIVGNEVANADLSRLTEAFDTARIEEAQRKLDDFVQTSRLNQQVAGLSSETQREFAETLRSLGIEFEVVNGQVHVLNGELLRTNEAIQSIQTDQASKKLEALKQAGEAFGQSVTDAFADIVLEAKSLEDVLEGLLKQLARALINQAIGSAVSGAFGSLFGGSVTSPSTGATASASAAQGLPAQFAQGGIVRGPVDIAGGTGVMGERGPEGILPLRVGAAGRLGVDASGIGGGSNSVTVNDYRRSGPDIEVEQESHGNDHFMEITIRDQVRKLASQGSLDDTFGSFGSNRQPVRR